MRSLSSSQDDRPSTPTQGRGDKGRRARATRHKDDFPTWKLGRGHLHVPTGSPLSDRGGNHLVCQLKKSLYGLKQALGMWYQKFDSYIRQLSYNWSDFGPCLYTRQVADECRIYICRRHADCWEQSSRNRKLKAEPT